jgi:hypothetical protein
MKLEICVRSTPVSKRLVGEELIGSLGENPQLTLLPSMVSFAAKDVVWIRPIRSNARNSKRTLKV